MSKPIRLIFLDIDGVLNNHVCDPMSMCGEIDSAKVRILNRVLFTTGAKLVLSSAWRYILFRREAKIEGIEWLLRSHGLHSGRIIGLRDKYRVIGPFAATTRSDTLKRKAYDGTPGSWPMENERGEQIRDWLRNFWTYLDYGQKARYVVIDDLDLGIREAGHPFVQTNGGMGLTDADANLVTDLLMGDLT